MRFLELYTLCQDNAAVVSKLQEWGLIPSEPNYKCKKCGGILKLARCSAVVDGWKWYCYNWFQKGKKKRVRCGTRFSIRSGTFFERSKLSILEILTFVRLWVLKASLFSIGEQLDLNQATLVNWASFFREVVELEFIENKRVLGGLGKIVEIDESVFGRRKYHKGKVVSEQGVFGAFERITGRVFLVPVEKRDADSLLPIIQRWIAPGTTIVSDCWRTYNCLEQKGYQKLRVNHNMNFKDPEIDGAHSNSVETMIWAAKATTQNSAQKRKLISGNLAKYMFLKGCEERNADPFTEFLGLVGHLYDQTTNRGENLPSIDECAVSSEDLDYIDDI